MSGIRRLVDYPWVLVRVRCEVCKRAGAYRLARLAVKYGAEILFDDLIVLRDRNYPVTKVSFYTLEEGTKRPHCFFSLLGVEGAMPGGARGGRTVFPPASKPLL
jgi:hypothetical protein